MDIESLIREHANRMVVSMPQLVARAQSEEDIRHEVNKHIDAFIDKAGLEITGRHEYGLAGGRGDSKFGGVIVEYKYPKGAGQLGDADSPGTKSVVEQIRKRFRDFHVHERTEPDRLFGVGTDGRSVVFVRHRRGQLEIEGPRNLTAYSIERLLRALVSVGSQGMAFTPEKLGAQFGADSPDTQLVVRHIYDVLIKTQSPKTESLFRQWKILFGEVCGYDVEGRNDKVRK
ncbi:hypothetical protein KKH27_10630 [bacterium]|nr:hypothetical protein [bacterium]MBU1984088.1 hypothetical protein [bacterium]